MRVQLSESSVNQHSTAYLWVTSACKPVFIVSTSCAMFLASPYFSTSPSQPSLTMMSNRGFPKAARTGDAVMLEGLAQLVSQSQGGPGCRDGGGPALVLSIEAEAACRAMLLPSPGNTSKRPKLCLATNRDITLVMTQSKVVRPQGAPWQNNFFSTHPSYYHRFGHILSLIHI